MRVRRKLITVCIVILVILVGGGLGAYQYAKTKVADKVIEVLNDPSVKQAIQKESQNKTLLAQAQKVTSQAIAKNGTSSSTSSNGSSSSSGTSATANANTDSVATSGSVGASSSSTSSLHFADRQAAVSYAMSKFSAGEIARFMADYANRSSLSGSKKAQIKQEILSHFSSEELQALLEASNR